VGPCPEREKIFFGNRARHYQPICRTRSRALQRALEFSAIGMLSPNYAERPRAFDELGISAMRFSQGPSHVICLPRHQLTVFAPWPFPVAGPRSYLTATSPGSIHENRNLLTSGNWDATSPSNGIPTMEAVFRKKSKSNPSGAWLIVRQRTGSRLIEA